MASFGSHIYITLYKNTFTAHRGYGRGIVATLHPDYFISYRLQCEDNH